MNTMFPFGSLDFVGLKSWTNWC